MRVYLCDWIYFLSSQHHVACVFLDFHKLWIHRALNITIPAVIRDGVLGVSCGRLAGVRCRLGNQATLRVIKASVQFDIQVALTIIHDRLKALLEGHLAGELKDFLPLGRVCR